MVIRGIIKLRHSRVMLKVKGLIKMKYITHKYLIPDWSACYFANADDSGLSEEDITDIKNFEAKLIKKHGHAFISVENTESNFEHYNDINSYGSNCITAILLEEVR